jgi:hypothetical protein
MFSRPEPLLSFQVALQLSSWGWVDPVPDPLFLRKSGSAGNQTWDLWICSQELWPLDHRGGQTYMYYVYWNVFISVQAVCLYLSSELPIKKCDKNYRGSGYSCDLGGAVTN